MHSHSLSSFLPCALSPNHPNPQSPQTSLLFSPSPTLPPPLRRLRIPRLRCGPERGDASANNLSGMVDSLLQREENRPLLDGLEAASRRVELAREALADIQRQEDEASRAREMILELQRREAQIAESQKELLEAKAMVEEAERSLSSESFIEGATDDIYKDMERLESVKAAVISSTVGTLAALPISFYQASSSAQLVQHLGVIVISCALFGVTFRYTIRRDLDNIQLKTGTAAAFGFVKGLAALEAAKPLEFDSSSLISHIFDGAMYVSESVLIFVFSAVALDFCFKTGLLSPFPFRK